MIIIATRPHLDSINEGLRKQNFDLDGLLQRGRYFPLDTHETLYKFLVNNWPNEAIFHEYVSGLVAQAGKGNRKVRAFDEMVAVFWSQGLNGATIQLEHLWHQLHSKKNLTLYCAYPKNGFTQCAKDSMETILQAHTRIISGESGPATEIYYRRNNSWASNGSY